MLMRSVIILYLLKQQLYIYLTSDGIYKYFMQYYKYYIPLIFAEDRGLV